MDVRRINIQATRVYPLNDDAFDEQRIQDAPRKPRALPRERNFVIARIDWGQRVFVDELPERVPAPSV
jgi:hypothetical protein